MAPPAAWKDAPAALAGSLVTGRSATGRPVWAKRRARRNPSAAVCIGGH